MIAGGLVAMGFDPALGRAWTVDVGLAGPLALLAAVLASVAVGLVVASFERRGGSERSARRRRRAATIVPAPAPGF